MNTSDKLHIMQTALLECSIHNNLKVDDLKIYQSKKDINTYYIVSSEWVNNKPVKVYFKKTFKK